jgi:hypothetical protein
MKYWSQWVSLLRTQESGTSLALFRMAVGLVVAWDLGGSAWRGVLPLIWGDSRETPEAFRHIHAGWLFHALGGAQFQTVESVLGLSFCAAILLALGLFPRLMAMMTLQGCMALYDLNAMAGGGHDRVISNALWILVLADSGQSLSLNCRWKTGRWRSDTLVMAWPRYLVILQLILMYSTTGLQKLAPEWFFWGDLRAVYNMLLVPNWLRYDLAPILGWLAPLTQLATLSTWIWECSFFMVGLSLLARNAPERWPRWLSRYDWRHLYAMMGIGFHVGLALLANLGPFSAISLALYPCLYRPEALDAWIFRQRSPK